MSDRRTLVAGVSGVIGRAVANELAATGASAIGMSRRTPDVDLGIDHLALDVVTAAGRPDALEKLSEVTHLVFAAYQGLADPRAQVEVNLQLLERTLDLLRAAGAPLEHVTLYQGMKYYGAHLGNYHTPAREDDPRLIGPNFYYDQEDLLVRRAATEGWHYTLFRPEGVCGVAVGNPMNLLTVIATLATLSRVRNVPLRFPGSLGAYHALYQVTDARLLARATLWAGSAPTAQNEAFNITNGDTLRWAHLFPAFAAFWGSGFGPPQPISLAEQLLHLQPVWDELVTTAQLRPTSYSDMAGWAFGDAIFHNEGDNVSSTIKLRQAGFAECIDTRQMFDELFTVLIDERYLPDPGGSR